MRDNREDPAVGLRAANTQRHRQRKPQQPKARVRVLLADDHPVVREGLRRFLQMQPGIEVVGMAVDGLEAMEQAVRLQPDVIVMDVGMPHLSGIEATRRIRADFPQIAIIGLSMYEEYDAGTAMRQAGACTYLAKTAEPMDLVAAIRCLAR